MTAALVEAGVTRDAGVLLADELRLGLRGQVRRVLAPRGVDVRRSRRLLQDVLESAPHAMEHALRRA